MLELVRVQNGNVYYTFRKSEDVNGYAIYHRISLDGAQTWEAWQRTERQLTGDTVEFGLAIGQGYMCETYVTAIGDGTKQESEPSNIITSIVPKEPAFSPPIIEAYPFYYNGRPRPFIRNTYIPTGVSKWVMWMRELGEADWAQKGVNTEGGNWLYVDDTLEFEVAYQFMSAWVSNDVAYILSDLSNIATLTLPDQSVSKLLPPIQLEAFFTIYDGEYRNMLRYGKGDMRSLGVIVQYKRSSEGVWKYVDSPTGDGKLPYDAQTLDDLSLYLPFRFISSSPITGEVWQYRLRNYAEGLETSEYSSIFEITIPSLLPRLDTPTMHLNKSGSAIIVSWGLVSDAVGYKVERRLSSETEFILLSNTIPSTMTSFNDSNNLVLGNTYVYRVTALGNGTNYQDSLPAEDSITYQEGYHLQPPVISNVAESGIDITMNISNLDGANSRTVYVEMSENNGAWTRVAAGNVASVAVTSISVTVEGWKINGGALRFRAYQYGGGIIEDSDYSDIVSITIDEREWLLRWNGTSWDDPSGLTGGWINQNVTWSDEVETSNITETAPATGVKRLQGQGWYRTVNPIIENQGNLLTKYSRICMIGSLVKQADGTSNHAWFGVAFTYPFMGGKNFDTSNGTYVYAGGESGRASAGTKVDPYFNPRASSSYVGKQGPYLFFRLHSGYADVKGIFAIKR